MSFKSTKATRLLVVLIAVSFLVVPALAQLIDKNKAAKAAERRDCQNACQEVGAGRGDVRTRESSTFIIRRDPFRSIRRGRQLFQRKMSRFEGQGPLVGDGVGDINRTLIDRGV